ncbi:class I SAM-dependent methyltransferase [Pseudenhygromyxa sp. WMMC2535]|uniref:class I SAM-dependent methyltransferase n=1 Tax=Pseudenhygromyxa sp. WMMC2535 TaxID=2712867 RepID=UPI001555CE15|nr:class I SAM-dependent methyltransferase [Pseudenhygromyxa sp. WMMC2535]NVB37092.1 class I SAM-dependent methyltransferase [Pseudenhygromyxa sp. WMMC2535]
MPRLHLIELHEQPWCPRVLRDGMRAVLQQISSTLPAYDAVIEVLLRAMQASGTTKVLDLCSGAGGPWDRLASRVADDPRIDHVLLTDLYPDAEAMEDLQRGTGGLCSPHLEPVNALDVPEDMPGFRTLFIAFHHFDPEQAKRVLANAVAAGRGVGVFELTERRPYSTCFVSLTMFPLALALLPFAQHRRAGFFVFTYLLPLIPALTTFDGMVSCMRSYHPEEMLAMAREVGPDYEWQAGRVRWPSSPVAVVYLTGVPPSR